MRPTWVEVSLGALRHNFHTLQEHIAPDSEVCAVVKAEAYGHGAVECARALQAEGAKWFGVTSTDEGTRLRRGGIGERILLLTGFWFGEEEDVACNRLTSAVWDWAQIEALDRAVAKIHPAEGFRLPVHLKVDTGMARLGVSMSALPAFLQRLKETEHIELEGVFTHLASADVVDAPDVERQMDNFDQALACVEACGFSPRIVHIANSAAAATRPRTWKTMVRAGLSLYGYYLPFRSAITGMAERSYELPVKPVLAWKSKILSVRDVPENQAIGYSGAYITPVPARIAVIPVGYGDGLSRHLSSRGRVIVREHYAPIVGNVCMDLTLIDVTHVPGVAVGDEVTLIGCTKRCAISAWEHASLAMTVPYEILCTINKQILRKYVR